MLTVLYSVEADRADLLRDRLLGHVVNKDILLQHICRSATLAGWGELYGRTGYNYIFSGE